MLALFPSIFLVLLLLLLLFFPKVLLLFLLVVLIFSAYTLLMNFVLLVLLLVFCWLIKTLLFWLSWTGWITFVYYGIFCTSLELLMVIPTVVKIFLLGRLVQLFFREILSFFLDWRTAPTFSLIYSWILPWLLLLIRDALLRRWLSCLRQHLLRRTLWLHYCLLLLHSIGRLLIYSGWCLSSLIILRLHSFQLPRCRWLCLLHGKIYQRC
jgi:hypothetical protein